MEKLRQRKYSPHYGKRSGVPEHLRDIYTEEEFYSLPNKIRYNLRYPEKLSTMKKTQYARNLEKDPDFYQKSRHNRWVKKLPFSEDRYWEMFKLQGGTCAICHEPPKDKKLCVDHNHDTGRIRGLLCHSCNLVLGFAHDNVEILSMSIVYLKHEKKEEI